MCSLFLQTVYIYRGYVIMVVIVSFLSISEIKLLNLKTMLYFRISQWSPSFGQFLSFQVPFSHRHHIIRLDDRHTAFTLLGKYTAPNNRPGVFHIRCGVTLLQWLYHNVLEYLQRQNKKTSHSPRFSSNKWDGRKTGTATAPSPNNPRRNTRLSLSAIQNVFASIRHGHILYIAVYKENKVVKVIYDENFKTELKSELNKIIYKFKL